MGVHIGDLILMIVGTVLFILAFIVLINNLMGQLYFFTLDPSKAVAQDISMRILASLATPGEVEMTYRNMTKDITYSFSNSNKVFCVSAKSQIAEIWSIDCSSLPFELNLEKEKVSDFELKIKKWFSSIEEKAEVETKWLY